MIDVLAIHADFKHCGPACHPRDLPEAEWQHTHESDCAKRNSAAVTAGTPLTAADWSGAVFCLTRCYACQFDECPGVPHTWGSPEDFEHAWATFQVAPGFCGCVCGRPPRTPPKVRVRCSLALPLGLSTIRHWSWNCPGCAAGSEVGHVATLAAAVEHRRSEGCKYRRAER